MSTSQLTNRGSSRAKQGHCDLREDTPTLPMRNQARLEEDAIGATAAGLPAVPGFRMLRIIGNGGMSTVYLARQDRLNRLVAIKMIRRDEWHDPELRERFRREAESIAALEHPNVVQIYEVGEVQGVPFLALEYVTGGALSQRMNGKTIGAKSAARILQQLAAAVQAAHDQNIIHRDLKPANILLAGSHAAPDDAGATSAGKIIPKIADFGLARFLTDDSRQTKSGFAIGTPSYMAPEQAAGRPDDIGTPADIYGLGTILYEMLTGRPPFEAESAIETVLKVRRDDPVPPGHINPRVPRDLETICLKCLEKEPAHRYPSATALANDLGRFLDGRPVLARPVGWPVRLMKWARRRPAAAATIGLGFLLLLAMVVSLIIMARLNSQLQQSDQQLEARNDELRNLTQEKENANRGLRQRIADGNMDTPSKIAYADDNPTDCWAQIWAYDALSAEGRHAEARPYIDRARQLTEAGGARHGLRGPEEDAAEAAAVLDRWGDHCRRLNDISGAIEAHDQALKARLALVEQFVGERRWVIEAGISFKKLAGLHASQSRFEDDSIALNLLKQRVEMLERLSEGDDRSEGIMESHYLIAELCWRMRKMPDAENHIRLADEINRGKFLDRAPRFVLPKGPRPMPAKK